MNNAQQTNPASPILGASFFSALGFNDTNGAPPAAADTEFKISAHSGPFGHALVRIKALGDEAAATLAAGAAATPAATSPAEPNTGLGSSISFGEGGHPFNKPGTVAAAAAQMTAGTAPAPAANAQMQAFAAPMEPMSVAEASTQLSLTASQAAEQAEQQSLDNARSLKLFRDMLQTLTFVQAYSDSIDIAPGSMIAVPAANGRRSIAVGTHYGNVKVLEIGKPNRASNKLDVKMTPHLAALGLVTSELTFKDITFILGDGKTNIGTYIEFNKTGPAFQTTEEQAAPAAVSPGEGMLAKASSFFDERFEQVEQGMSYNPEWKVDGDLFEIKDGDYLATILKVGEQAKATSEDGRKIIVTQTPMGPVMVYQRYPGGTATLAFNAPECLTAMGTIRSQPTRLSEEEARAILGTADAPNLGAKLAMYFN